jgi:hypothetical protein
MRFDLRALLAAGTCAVGLCIGTSVQAASDKQSEQLLYVMQFGGLTIADVMITLSETPEHYQTSIKLRSRGLLARFKHFNADLAGEGALTNAALKTAPDSYRRDWSMDTLSSTLEISYDPQKHLATSAERLFNPVTGEPKRREDEPWNRHERAPKPVPPDKRTAVLDPIAAFIAAREVVRGASQPKSFRVPVYDGLRRYDIVATSEAPRETTVNDQTRRVIAVKGRLEPVFGFDDNLQDKLHDGEGRILFTADGRALPVQIMIGNSLGVGVMNLVADCRVDPKPCETMAGDQAEAQLPHN